MDGTDERARTAAPDRSPVNGRSGRLRLATPPAVRDGLLPAQAVVDLWQAVGGASQPMYLADAAGNLIYANAAYNRIAPRLQLGDVAVEDIAAAIDALGRPLRQDVVIQMDERTECYIAERMVVRDGAGQPFAVMGRFVPADELRRVETALRITEDRFDDMARLTSDWVWETDTDLVITFVSGRGPERLGYAARELVGCPMQDLLEPGAALDPLLTSRSRRTVRDAPVGMRHKDGSLPRFLLSAVPVFDEETGALRGFRGTAQDVTEREAQFAALLKAVDDSEAANRAKTEFLANMSHELRTPLNAIMGFSEAMKLELIGPLGNERYRGYAEDILTSSRHLLRVLNDILDVAKIEAGRMELDEAEIDSSELLDIVQRIVAENAKRANLGLHVDRTAELPRIRADERRLKQVLLNLLSNAVKFTPAGGEVTLSAERTRDGGLDFVVSDTGVGIAPHEIATAMAPFRQLDTGLSRKFEGTGLGLPLSKALTELHGGSLRLESRIGEGTTARVHLPASRVLAA